MRKTHPWPALCLAALCLAALGLAGFSRATVGDASKGRHEPGALDERRADYLEDELTGRQLAALHADFALVRARKVDPFGNVRFWRTARNFAPIMATAATTTIVEADELVPLGGIDPDDVHLPGVFVHRIVEVTEHEDPFEYEMTRPRPAASTGGS